MTVAMRKHVVVIGNGMVGQRFCEKLRKYDTDKKFKITCVGEESRRHYNRMLLTEYFEHKTAENLYLAADDWYATNEVDVMVDVQVESIDHAKKELITKDSKVPNIKYDYVVLATGSFAFLPPVPGHDYEGVYVYRTLTDLDNMLSYIHDTPPTDVPRPKPKAAAVFGGGLLGLEAAKALRDEGLEVCILEINPWLMRRQLDEPGATLLKNKVEELGIRVHVNAKCGIMGDNGRVTGIRFEDGTVKGIEVVVFACGIRPRDEVAKASGVNVHERGGILVDDNLATNVEDVYGIGECVIHQGRVYGLVNPGYAMADVLAHRLTDSSDVRIFESGDMSTKLKLMGVDVASFGNYMPPKDSKEFMPLVYDNPAEGVYRKLIFTADAKHIVGGMMVGDASDYSKLLLTSQSAKPLKDSPSVYLLGKAASSGAGTVTEDDLPDDAQVCSCNDVTKGDIKKAIHEQGLTCLKDVKTCSSAGTGCGGCVPMVKDILDFEMKKMGATVDNSLCEHFAYTRKEMFDMIRIKEYCTFTAVLKDHGTGFGCEICKPTVASILASLYNSHILDGELFTLQDSNDRFLANLQKNGTYSVIPRIPGGEITPEKLVVIGDVGKKYGLYTKLTGGQRIDLLGAMAWQLPHIWKDLVDAGFESGHAYGKALRTVKSCVGSAWCRYGRGDAVGLAIMLEERYRGIRSPHKLKGGVSGCVRECAEAQSKDFGLIATETGYNLYVGGNGGTTPRHAQLFASDISEELVIKYIDRYLMYYIHTADRLERTAKWLTKLEGGVEQLKRVVIDDALGLAETLDAHMALLIDTYVCEWKKVVDNPERWAYFDQFRNTTAKQDMITLESTRDQIRPVMLPTPPSSPSGAERALLEYEKTKMEWIPVGEAKQYAPNSGGSILYGATQLAVFHTARNWNGIEQVAWYATQNMCPHTNAFVLSSGMVGDSNSKMKVACPLHKNTFDLETGQCLTMDQYKLYQFDMKEVDGELYALLPPTAVVDAVLATQKFLSVDAEMELSKCAKLDW
ncbi:hypothetical protein SARC_08918 [Sphaeroforma arctica JP610]|uniref:Nitrite reductase [NAD(P)H] n=1 Tax=Sphaeroforma arctica JP610 TaxID=667725 RepID=A0A0L0FPC1_9EUKA|nr:hypothetical protein SARC_08918 [Sphaeroforma arctica JP610]KNC78660.1 hypothetical protein SARC_08918 [Sphaeroforma arctica JP610]|eukprot:XP_014152562.1 hypothetical protein SARC_08918 [Sphaeroforma arctica JP610]